MEPNPLFQILKRENPSKQPGLGKHSGFRVKGHGDVGQLTDRHQSDERMIAPRPDTKCPIPLFQKGLGSFLDGKIPSLILGHGNRAPHSF